MRKRYVQDRDTGELIEVGPDYAPAPMANTDAYLWNDRLYQDGNDAIKSRKQHRDYMRQHGLTTVDDFQGEWKRAEKQRFEGKSGVDPSRRRDISRAISQLNNRRR